MLSVVLPMKALLYFQFTYTFFGLKKCQHFKIDSRLADWFLSLEILTLTLRSRREQVRYKGLCTEECASKPALCKLSLIQVPLFLCFTSEHLAGQIGLPAPSLCHRGQKTLSIPCTNT